MAYSLGNKCAKNLCKRIVLLQLIIENVVTCFFGTQCIIGFALNGPPKLVFGGFGPLNMIWHQRYSQKAYLGVKRVLSHKSFRSSYLRSVDEMIEFVCLPDCVCERKKLKTFPIFPTKLGVPILLGVAQQLNSTTYSYVPVDVWIFSVILYLLGIKFSVFPYTLVMASKTAYCTTVHTRDKLCSVIQSSVRELNSNKKHSILIVLHFSVFAAEHIF